MRLLVHIADADSNARYFAVVAMPNNEAPTDAEIIKKLSGSVGERDYITDRIVISDDQLGIVDTNDVYNSVW